MTGCLDAKLTRIGGDLRAVVTPVCTVVPPGFLRTSEGVYFRSKDRERIIIKTR